VLHVAHEACDSALSGKLLLALNAEALVHALASLYIAIDTASYGTRCKAMLLLTHLVHASRDLPHLDNMLPSVLQTSAHERIWCYTRGLVILSTLMSLAGEMCGRHMALHLEQPRQPVGCCTGGLPWSHCEARLLQLAQAAPRQLQGQGAAGTGAALLD
jgi:hypothetical protein